MSIEKKAIYNISAHGLLPSFDYNHFFTPWQFNFSNFLN